MSSILQYKFILYENFTQGKIQAAKNEQSNLQNSYWFPKGVLAIGNQLAACKIRALIARKAKQGGTVFLAFHSAVHYTGMGAYKWMQQILSAWATKGLTIPQERTFKNCMYFTSGFYLLINYFTKAKPEKIKIPPALQKEQLRVWFFCLLVSWFKKKACAFIYLTPLLLFLWTSAGVRFILFSTLCLHPSFFVHLTRQEGLKGRNTKTRFRVFLFYYFCPSFSAK